MSVIPMRVTSPQSVSEQVAGQVRAEMARAGVSGAKLARHLDWSEMYLSRRLKARTPFDVEDLAAIAAALGVDITRLVGRARQDSNLQPSDPKIDTSTIRRRQRPLYLVAGH